MLAFSRSVVKSAYVLRCVLMSMEFIGLAFLNINKYILLHASSVMFISCVQILSHSGNTVYKLYTY